jgi:xanthine dehydrogenase accessory factor
MTPSLLAALQEARANKRPVVLATRLRDGAQMLLSDHTAEPELADPAEPELTDAARVALVRDESRTVQASGAEWFLHVYNPPFRLVVIGAVHIAQAMVPMAAVLGIATTIIDPRRSFATDERFPGVTLLTDWPDEAMDAVQPDSRTAVVALTHDPKLDDPGLDRALRSPALYVGALGSRKTQAARLRRLAALGHDPATLARIHGPIGLNIEAVTAPEVALSIMAEIVAVRRHAAIARREALQAAA